MFETRAVAFLDILGFKELIDKVEKSNNPLELYSLKAVLDSHVKWDNERLVGISDKDKPKYIFISDSIILSAPMGAKFDGLGAVVAKSIEIAQKLFEMGHLLRGGISVGNVWHEERNIFGSGYISAVKTEQHADMPRLLLDPAATQHWEESDFLKQSSMCISDGNHLIADIWQPLYIRGAEMHGRIDDAYKSYRIWILQNLENLLAGRPRAKWEWIAQAFNTAIVRYGVTVEPIRLLLLPGA